MPRAPTILQPEFPYHVTARCINRDWFSLPQPQVWEIMSDQLWFVYRAFKFEIHAFALMGNHFHLFVETPLSNLDEGMAWFMRETSRSLTKSSSRINQTYGARYFRCIVKSDHHYLNVYKYLYHNPIHAGISQNILDYPYTSLSGLMGKTKITFPVKHDRTLFDDPDGTIRWLNERPDENNWNAVAKALKKKEFRLAKVNSRPHPLEFDTL